MAFPAAPGHQNLPNGVFSPTIYSKKVQLAFRKSSVVNDVTNSEYFGEIANFGDSVRIIKEPTITVNPYKRGTQVQTQDLIDEDFNLIIDKANYWAFMTDDIEIQQSHVNWLEMATSQAAYSLRDNYDQEILGYMSGYKQVANGQVASVARTAADIPGTKAIDAADDDELLGIHKLKKGDFSQITTASAGDHSIPLAPRLPGITALPTSLISPLTLFSRAARLMTQQNVPRENRWAIVDPVFLELLSDEDSKLFNADWGKTGGLRNGMVTDTPIQGFRLYESQNLPQVGDGPGTTGTTNQNTDYGVIIFGHDSAVATAEQLTKSESMRSEDTFGDKFRGMHLYGRKLLRPESIVTAKYNVA